MINIVYVYKQKNFLFSENLIIRERLGHLLKAIKALASRLNTDPGRLHVFIRIRNVKENAEERESKCNLRFRHRPPPRTSQMTSNITCLPIQNARLLLHPRMVVEGPSADAMGGHDENIGSILARSIGLSTVAKRMGSA